MYTVTPFIYYFLNIAILYLNKIYNELHKNLWGNYYIANIKHNPIPNLAGFRRSEKKV